MIVYAIGLLLIFVSGMIAGALWLPTQDWFLKIAWPELLTEDTPENEPLKFEYKVTPEVEERPVPFTAPKS